MDLRIIDKTIGIGIAIIIGYLGDLAGGQLLAPIVEGWTADGGPPAPYSIFSMPFWPRN